MRLNVQCGLMFSMCCFKFMLHEATDILIVDISYLTIKQVASKGRCCLNCRIIWMYIAIRKPYQYAFIDWKAILY